MSVKLLQILGRFFLIALPRQVAEPPQKSAKKSSKLKAARSKILSKSQHGSEDPEVDEVLKKAQEAIDEYLCKPVSDDTDTFQFWREYDKSGNEVKKELARLARIYLTPAPTSTDVERLGCELTVPFLVLSLSNNWQ